MRERPFSTHASIGALFIVGSLLCCCAPASRAAAWEGYGRSLPIPRYEQDESARRDYLYGVTEAFKPYKDPPLAEAEPLPNPLFASQFHTYNLIVIINKKTDPFWGRAQTLRAYLRGKGLIYYWLISTGAPSFETPSGYYVPQGFSSRHWSRPYDAPMLWAVFFNAGIALHSSLDREALRDMGKAAASHGCVRIEDHRAEELFHRIGHSGFGWVDQIDRRTGMPLMKKGKPRQIQAYRTLIVVAPTRRWTDGSPARQETAPAMAPKTAPESAKKAGAGTTQTPPKGPKPAKPMLEDLF